MRADRRALPQEDLCSGSGGQSAERRPRWCAGWGLTYGMGIMAIAMNAKRVVPQWYVSRAYSCSVNSGNIVPIMFPGERDVSVEKRVNAGPGILTREALACERGGREDAVAGHGISVVWMVCHLQRGHVPVCQVREHGDVDDEECGHDHLRRSSRRGAVSGERKQGDGTSLRRCP